MIDKKIITLTDGTTLSVGVNFLTLYYIKKRKIDEKLEEGIKDDSEGIELAAELIYIIMRSAGKEVAFDEALRLTPIDTDVINDLFNDFSAELENYKKKEQAKSEMRNFVKSK